MSDLGSHDNDVPYTVLDLWRPEGPRDGWQLDEDGMTMVCVTHEMGFARKVSNRVIFMDQGRIIEDCSKDEFFGNPDARSPRAKDFLSKILAG